MAMGGGAPGPCTLEGSIKLEQLVSTFAYGGCIALVATAQRHLQALWPAAGFQHTVWPLLLAALTGAIIVGAQLGGVALVRHFTHWEVPPDKAGALGTALCETHSALANLAVALRWNAWACLFGPLLTVLPHGRRHLGSAARGQGPLVVLGSFRLRRRLAGHLAGHLQGEQEQASWSARPPAGLELQAWGEEAKRLRDLYADLSRQLAAAQEQPGAQGVGAAGGGDAQAAAVGGEVGGQGAARSFKKVPWSGASRTGRCRQTRRARLAPSCAGHTARSPTSQWP